LTEHINDARHGNGNNFAGYLIILATQVMCSEFSQCYDDVNICLRIDGSQKSRSEAQSYCEEKQRNSSLPRITNSDIQNKLADFRSADKSRENLLKNSGFWIDVNATAISDFHWIDGSSLTGHFIYEFAGIVVL